jgi:tRNA/tmRNA/rRNA uracil-C5-methylase (TrmA/RlmC/RlmD family)
VDIPRCLVHHPLVNRVAAAVRAALRRTGVAPYSETAHRGILRYLQVVVERPSGRAQVVLVANGDDPRLLAPLAAAVETELGDGLHSLWWNGNPARTNTILGPHWHRWAGPEAVCELLGGARVFFPPGAFGQTNLPLMERIVAQVAAWVPDGAAVAEFHAGCGTIGLGLLARSARVDFNEASPAARERATVLAGPAATHREAARGADVVIVDPPRKGLDAELLAQLVREPPRRLIAISCNPAALAREARALTGDGGLALRALVPYALFPYTAHVETVALFERRT